MNEPIQERAEQMAEGYSNIGCGLWRFERTGRAQIRTLIGHGLNPWSKLLDVGSGAFCGAYWMIHFLDEGCYHGIEPNREMLAAGMANIAEPDLIERKKPRFDHNDRFNFSPFGQKFDFFHAHSIWTHSSKAHIETMLDGFVEHSADRAVFLTSFKRPIPLVRPDYKGSEWVGASHEQEEAGIVRHDFGWVRRQCERRGLTATLAEKIHKQRYIRIEKCG